MLSQEIEAQFSANRLGGDALPGDLRILLENRDELAQRTGIVLDWSTDWAPWLDNSYLSPDALKKPEIRAAVRATEDVCRMSSFVIASEDSNFLGYWRGPARLPIERA